MAFLVFKPNLKLAVICVVADVAIQLQLATGTGAYAARVTIAPQTVVALVDASATAQFTCEVRDAVGLDWFLDGTHDSSFAGAVSKTDFSVSGGAAVFSSSLSVSTAEEFDNLQVVCRARGSSESESSDSNVAWLYLEAPLVTPYNIEVLYAVDTDLIYLNWACGIAEHVELHYNVTIKAEDSQMVKQTNATDISFGPELDHPFAELCTNYTFSVVAWSVLDTSDASEPVNAGFHCPLPSVSVLPTSQVVSTIPEPNTSDIDAATPGISATSGPSTDNEERKNAAIIIITVTVVLAMITMLLLLSVAIMVTVFLIRKRQKAATYDMKEKGKEVCSPSGSDKAEPETLEHKATANDREESVATCEIKEKEEVSLSDCSPSGRDNNAEALECTDVDTANNKEETVASTAPAICRQFSNDSNAPLMDN